jgi:DNA-binding CsgD family transcriptional regulator/tetratricopeptide (TPR) repeat protein
MPPSPILLEREAPLAQLQASLAALGQRESAGRCLLLQGEAGIGKTSLLRRLRDAAPAGLSWLVGTCEPWLSPSPLGPLVDFVGELPPSLAQAVRSGAPLRELLLPVLDLLRDARQPRVLVIDDAQWADSATLDLLRFVGRRIGSTHAALVVSYRDDELGADHPLRGVLASLPGEHTLRIVLPPLSLAAVEAWAQRAGRADAASIWRLTAGNPFFVGELLDGAADGLPATVRDAVLARAARLPPQARELLDWVCVEPALIELPLLARLMPSASQALVHGEACGLLRSDGNGVSFRHDLARRAFEESLVPTRRRELHARLLDALATFAASAVRRVHHAQQAGRLDDVAVWAPRAAAEAAQAGAHRQAASLYGLALSGNGAAQRLKWLQARAHAELMCNRHDKAIADRSAALSLARDLGDAEGIGRNQIWLARLHWMRDGDVAGAVPWVEAAIEALGLQPPGRVLAQAYSTRAHLALAADDLSATQHWGERAVALAESTGDAQVLAHALTNLGAARAFGGALDAGLIELRHSLDIAIERRFHDDAARAYVNIFLVLGNARRLASALEWADTGVAYSELHGLDVFTVRLRVRRALARLLAGQWAAAEADLGEVAKRHSPPPTEAAVAAFVGALLALRRGQQGARRRLATAVDQMRRHHVELWFTHTAAALAEAAWLDADPGATLAVLAEAPRLPDPWRAGELALWRYRCGGDAPDVEHLPLPLAHEAAGRVRDAAAGWQQLGSPYDQALALLSGDRDDLRKALTLLDGLGAEAAARLARRRLRAMGERAVARGRYGHARHDVLGLTARERQVLELIGQGLINREIAATLHRSERTVENHVAALLGKLGVNDRHEAVQRLRDSDSREP